MMKKAARLLVGVILALELVSCGVVGKAISGGGPLLEQSIFKQTYSIGAIVEAHQDLLLEGPRTWVARKLDREYLSFKVKKI